MNSPQVPELKGLKWTILHGPNFVFPLLQMIIFKSIWELLVTIQRQLCQYFLLKGCCNWPVLGPLNHATSSWLSGEYHLVLTSKQVLVSWLLPTWGQWLRPSPAPICVPKMFQVLLLQFWGSSRPLAPNPLMSPSSWDLISAEPTCVGQREMAQGELQCDLTRRQDRLPQRGSEMRETSVHTGHGCTQPGLIPHLPVSPLPFPVFSPEYSLLYFTQSHWHSTQPSQIPVILFPPSYGFQSPDRLSSGLSLVLLMAIGKGWEDVCSWLYLCCPTSVRFTFLCPFCLSLPLVLFFVRKRLNILKIFSFKHMILWNIWKSEQ